MSEPTTEAAATERFSLGTLEIPVRITDGSSLAFIHRVDLAAARDVVASDCFEPLPVGGKALTQLLVMEHRETSVGPYAELALLVLARRRGTVPSAMRTLVAIPEVDDAGWYVATLPVTTGFSCAAARELWGFPAYVTRVDTDFARARTGVVLGEELMIEHRSRFGVTVPSPPYVYFSEREGRLLRTVVSSTHGVRMGGARSVRIQVAGDGPTADIVRRLGLDQRRPMLAARADHVAFHLPLGTPAGTVPLRSI